MVERATIDVFNDDCIKAAAKSGKFMLNIMLIFKTILWNVQNRETRVAPTTVEQTFGGKVSARVSQWLINMRAKSEVKKIYNSHKIFMVMLATLLPCLFSTMHEYTPLSVRFNPLLNVKACADERSSLVSKRFQRYFGAKFSKERHKNTSAQERKCN